MKGFSLNKAVSLTLALTLAFGVAGCSSEDTNKNAGNVNSTVSGDGPLGIDTDSIYDETLDKAVLKEFPDDKFNTKTGIEQTLQTYEDLNNIPEFWSPRDTSEDMKYLEPYKDKFLDTAYGEMELQVKDYGQLNALFILSGEGVLLETKDNGETIEHKVSQDNPPSNEFSISSIHLNEDKSSIVLDGIREWEYFTAGPTFVGSNDFSIDITPVDGSWKISSMEWSNLKSEVK
ncbi:MAG: hypothetical protein H9W81_01160 [Enterococcus sp.]|nr:hypothetical protein [Enterococcus sp.]